MYFMQTQDKNTGLVRILGTAERISSRPILAWGTTIGARVLIPSTYTPIVFRVLGSDADIGSSMTAHCPRSCLTVGQPLNRN